MGKEIDTQHVYAYVNAPQLTVSEYFKDDHQSGYTITLL